jgi:NADH-quinone oxidoreductase subunit L
MSVPLILLALASATVGFIPFNELVTSDGKAFHVHTHWDIAIPSIAIAVAGISTAMLFYKRENTMPEKLASSLGNFYKAAYHKFYFDELYLFITKKIIFRFISEPIARFDKKIVDGAMDGIAAMTNYSSEKIKSLQSGQLQHYAYVFVSGVIIIVLIFLHLIEKQ